MEIFAGNLQKKEWLTLAGGPERHFYQPDETVLVGDTSYDMAMAVNARATGLGVSWGYHPPRELSAAGAAQIVDSFSDLIPALGALRKETQ